MFGSLRRSFRKRLYKLLPLCLHTGDIPLRYSAFRCPCRSGTLSHHRLSASFRHSSRLSFRPYLLRCLSHDRVRVPAFRSGRPLDRKGLRHLCRSRRRLAPRCLGLRPKTGLLRPTLLALSRCLENKKRVKEGVDSLNFKVEEKAYRYLQKRKSMFETYHSLDQSSLRRRYLFRHRTGRASGGSQSRS